MICICICCCALVSCQILSNPFTIIICLSTALTLAEPRFSRNIFVSLVSPGDFSTDFNITYYYYYYLYLYSMSSSSGPIFLLHACCRTVEIERFDLLVHNNCITTARANVSHRCRSTTVLQDSCGSRRI